MNNMNKLYDSDQPDGWVDAGQSDPVLCFTKQLKHQ